eukprot:TRINITY_DN24372_c0_g1_i2.p1 TRINITY_DN24372_c0_g1~~TRINITY_DN24372_c0_g1_i2.p1  ORF type:complete len:538 (+),score=103.40 TRINITY_DN24372_c0_g1_i2:97-1710(+)
MCEAADVIAPQPGGAHFGQPLQGDGDLRLSMFVAAVRPKGGVFGIMYENGPMGVRISSVVPGSAASDAGLRPGDYIASVDGYLVKGGDELSVTLRNKAGAETVGLRVVRPNFWTPPPPHVRVPLAQKPCLEPCWQGAHRSGVLDALTEVLIAPRHTPTGNLQQSNSAVDYCTQLAMHYAQGIHTAGDDSPNWEQVAFAPQSPEVPFFPYEPGAEAYFTPRSSSDPDLYATPSAYHSALAIAASGGRGNYVSVSPGQCGPVPDCYLFPVAHVGSSDFPATGGHQTPERHPHPIQRPPEPFRQPDLGDPEGRESTEPGTPLPHPIARVSPSLTFNDDLSLPPLTEADSLSPRPPSELQGASRVSVSGGQQRDAPAEDPSAKPHRPVPKPCRCREACRGQGNSRTWGRTCKTVHVAGFPRNVTTRDVREWCWRVGGAEVVQVRLCARPGESVTLAFIECPTRQDAVRVLGLDNSRYGKHYVTCSPARSAIGERSGGGGPPQAELLGQWQGPASHRGADVAPGDRRRESCKPSWCPGKSVG